LVTVRWSASCTSRNHERRCLSLRSISSTLQRLPRGNVFHAATRWSDEVELRDRPGRKPSLGICFQPLRASLGKIARTSASATGFPLFSSTPPTGETSLVMRNHNAASVTDNHTTDAADAALWRNA